MQFRMSVLLAREEEAKRAEEKAAAANSPLLYNHKIVNGDKISKVRWLRLRITVCESL